MEGVEKSFYLFIYLSIPGVKGIVEFSETIAHFPQRAQRHEIDLTCLGRQQVA